MFTSARSITVLLVCLLASAVTSPVAAEKVLARVDGVDVTESEVMDLASGQLLKLERQRHDLVANTVTGRIQEILTENEAKRRGITAEELVKLEVDGKLDTIPAADVEAFYNARRLRQPKEAVEPQIRRFLAQQKFIEALEAAAQIDVMTEPFRIEVGAEGPAKGKKGAPVTIVEYGDFECPPCRAAYPTIKKLAENYPDQVRVVFRQYPLHSIHPNAQKAGEASFCADDQGKFWEMHDKMFENQRNLAVDGLKSMAAEIVGLDTGAFNTCLDSGRHADRVNEDQQAGSKVGVSGTPSFFVNGRFLSGAPSYEAFAEIVEEEIALTKGASGP